MTACVHVTGGSAGSVSPRSTRMTLIRPFGSMYARPTTAKLNVASRAQLAGLDLS
ncbi:hypothetical protein ACWEQG_14355 [Microbispora sp. NPDC004025]